MFNLTQTQTDLGGATDNPLSGIIAIDGMHKWYGEFHVLKNINLEVKTGERIVICGPSGSGKSTALNAFEDLGYFCVENLPAPLITHFVGFLCDLM